MWFKPQEELAGERWPWPRSVLPVGQGVTVPLCWAAARGDRLRLLAELQRMPLSHPTLDKSVCWMISLFRHG